MRLEFATAHRIVFGPGTVKEAGAAAQALGRRPLVATGRSPARAEPLLAALRPQGLSYVTFAIAEEPTS